MAATTTQIAALVLVTIDGPDPTLTTDVPCPSVEAMLRDPKTAWHVAAVFSARDITHDLGLDLSKPAPPDSPSGAANTNTPKPTPNAPGSP